MSRGSSLPFSSLSSLEVGGTISFGGREIEIMEDLKYETVIMLKKSTIEDQSKFTNSWYTANIIWNVFPTLFSLLASTLKVEQTSPLKSNEQVTRKPFQKPSMMRQQMKVNPSEIQRLVEKFCKIYYARYFFLNFGTNTFSQFAISLFFFKVNVRHGKPLCSCHA